MSWQPTIGATVQDNGVVFRVWAPEHRQVSVTLYQDNRVSTIYPLKPEGNGYWSKLVRGVGAGLCYKFRLSGGKDLPDPASRYQPSGVHGPSMVVDPNFQWTDTHWCGISREKMIIYEIHVGTATPQGTFEALIEHLPGLRELGITAIEIMPVADFPGERNWGYDGVDLFAPARVYGGGAGLKKLVDAAHAVGLAVLLDVVYNHFGPSGNYLRDYARHYFTSRHHTPWGEAINFDGEDSEEVRTFFIENALYWANEFHLDGLRLDATQEIIDNSPEHILVQLVKELRASLPPERCFVVFAEDSRNESRLVQPPSEGGLGLDGIWADDFSHVVRVTLTGEQDSFFYAYQGGANELATILQDGWLYQGQIDLLTLKPRGTPPGGLPPACLVHSIQTHDHVGNRAFGERLNHQVSLPAYRAASALLLLSPHIPLLFMGQEWAASTPFLFFTDHDNELGPLITTGRSKDYGFEGIQIPDPQALETYQRSKLVWDEQKTSAHEPILMLYRDLLAFRGREPTYQGLHRDQIEVKIAGDKAVLLLLNNPSSSDSLLLIAVNLGETTGFKFDLFASIASSWELIFDTEDPSYGGIGSPLKDDWRRQGELNGPRALVFRGPLRN